MKRIVGLDPGSNHLGLACIAKDRQTVKLIHAETLHAPKGAPFFDRLEWIWKELPHRIRGLKPDEVALEDTFFSKNPRSAFQLGMARGVALASCLSPGVRIFEYAPTKVKMVVTGHGKADKEQVRKMVGLILGQKINLGLDATDAIAVAICHAHTLRIEAGNA